MIRFTSEYRACMRDLKSLELRIGRLRRQLIADGVGRDAIEQALGPLTEQRNARRAEIREYERGKERPHK